MTWSYAFVPVSGQKQNWRVLADIGEGFKMGVIMRNRINQVLWPVACLVAVCWSPVALAQYKCVMNGKTVYADAPCAANAKHVGELQDRLTDEQQIQRLQQSIKERKERNRIDGQQNAEFESQQRSMQRQASAEQSQARVDESVKRSRCAGLQRDMDYNRQGVARYQDFGWQRQLTEQENQLKRNREAYDRDCR